jgi:hypothetical protein
MQICISVIQKKEKKLKKQHSKLLLKIAKVSNIFSEMRVFYNPSRTAVMSDIFATKPPKKLNSLLGNFSE